MTTISKISVHLLCSLLRDYGVRKVVVSSGSRCAPITVALSRTGCFDIYPVIDERSAAFIALGMALASDEIVAIVCTSGSAALNFAPALSEAYYRRIPLIAITADRPLSYVDQRQGQTIRQAGCLDSVVKYSIDVPECSDTNSITYVNRIINEALTKAKGRIKGPVHINMRLEAPLTPFCDSAALPEAKMIRTISDVNTQSIPVLSELIASRSKIVLLVGGIRLTKTESNAIENLRQNHDVVVVAEKQTNLQSAITPASIDRLLKEVPAPDIVAILGGNLISNRFSHWLQNLENTLFISGGFEDGLVDTFHQLDYHFDCSPLSFIRSFETAAPNDGFEEKWFSIAKCGIKLQNIHSPSVDIIQELANSFEGRLIHVSNGTSARIAQLIEWPNGSCIEINRGVNGIDGSTSTAIGAAMIEKRPVLFISGDMSAAYDIGAFATDGITDTFKMAVLDNQGGDIFRNISTTSKLAERDRLFVMSPNLPLSQLAKAYNFAYFECRKATDDTIKKFIHHPGKSLLRIIVKPEESTGLI